jgi:phospholipase C
MALVVALRVLPFVVAPIVSLVCSCSSSSSSGTTHDAGPPEGGPPVVAPTASSIKHVVIVVMENHSFDAYFGGYCTAATGSGPTCSTGPACCEAAPTKDPGTGMTATILDDAENGAFDPDHTQQCELAEMDGGKMDKYATAPTLPTGTPCGSIHNVAIADAATATPYWNLARSGALADHYFQSVAGQSSSNDMYFAVTRFVFADNNDTPTSIGSACQVPAAPGSFTDTTIGDLLSQASVPWAFYAEGYQAMLDAQLKKKCPQPPADCPTTTQTFSCTYAPGDNPFQFYASLRDDPNHMLDYGRFATDVSGGSLPGVSFVKPVGHHSEHPGTGNTISAGSTFIAAVVGAVAGSAYAADTLVLVTYDESGGYFDHVAPPAMSAVDQVPYGPRIPLIAVGAFARKNYVSHVQMEHSSIVKFIEWNWLGQKTGQLAGRDGAVANLGDLLDPATTGVAVPAQ